MAVKPIPDGYQTATPYLSIKGAADALDFYRRAFGARELLRLDAPDGSVGHAEILIGDSHLMLSDYCGESPMPSPDEIGGTSVALYLYVEDVDGLFEQAVAAGATVVRAVEDQFYGDRTGTLRDPFGHVWFIATHKEDLSQQEIEERAAAMFGTS